MKEIVTGYLSLRVSIQSSVAIKKFFSNKGLVCNIDELHSALLYAKEIIPAVVMGYSQALRLDKPISAEIVGGEILENRDKGSRSPVLLMESPDARIIRDHLVEWGWHRYINEHPLHIPINYNLSEEEMSKYLSVINELVGMKIEYDAIESKTITPRVETIAE